MDGKSFDDGANWRLSHTEPATWSATCRPSYWSLPVIVLEPAGHRIGAGRP